MELSNNQKNHIGNALLFMCRYSYNRRTSADMACNSALKSLWEFVSDSHKQKILEEIKEQDWCYSSEEHELGVHALAVPIYGPKGNVVAALNIVSPTTKTTKEYLVQQIMPLLLETARELRNVI